MSTVKALKEYGKVSVQSGASYATPHRLILMLLDGALEKISSAKGFMQRGEIENKGNYISWAISIIEGLRQSLDSETGGEMAGNLDNLYEYMGRRLLEANYHNDEAMLDEVAGLLNSIKSSWMKIPVDLQGGAVEQDNTVNLSGAANTGAV